MPAVRYKVITYGGVDGLRFPDILVKYSSGLQYPLHVKEGDYLPTEILDPLDVEKSRILGSLGKYIASRHVIVEREVVVKPPVPVVSPSNAPVEKLDDTPPKLTSEVVLPVPEPEKEAAPVVETKFDVGAIATVEQFQTLSHFQKLSFIKQTQNLDLLKQIHEVTTVLQFKNNITRRLKEST